MGTVSLEDRRRWDERYRRARELPAPPGWLEEHSPRLPREGRALDVAAGTGPVARWLARRGLDVTAVDISAVGLELAEREARAAGVSLSTRVVDLQSEPLPAGPFACISCFHYYQPGLLPALRGRLAPGGVLILELHTRDNLERHPHPSARYLARPGEVRALCGPLQVLYYDEGWLEGYARARALARRPG